MTANDDNAVLIRFLKGPVNGEEEATVLMLIVRRAIFGPEVATHALLPHDPESQVSGKIIAQHKV